MTHSPIPDDSHNNPENSSPSDFQSSVETSPAIIPLSEPAASDGGHSPSPTSTRPSFQHRHSLDPQKSVSAAGRGGCWTCRLRRKKCDEQREEGDSCRWGPRRPDWMRDKEAVQNYKMEIKTHLLRLGLIRGQPRTSLSASSSSQASIVGKAGVSGATTSRAGSERGSFSYPFDDPQQFEFSFPSGIPSIPGNAPIPSPSVASSPFSDTWVQGDLYELSNILVPPTSPGLAGVADGGGLPCLPPENFSNIPGAGSGFQWAMQPVGITDQDAAVKREHIAYYFNHVARFAVFIHMQGCPRRYTSHRYSATRWVRVHCQTLCVQLRVGSMQKRSAGHHYLIPIPTSWMRPSHSFSSTKERTSSTPARRQGRWGIVAGVNASVGGTEWTPMLELACDWLAQTGMHVDENPRLFIINMPLPAAYAAKVIMCMDIFMGVTLQQPPRLLALYRRLLTGTGTSSHIWSGSQGGNTPDWELHIPLLVGCTEQVLLAFAEIAALAHWKAHEARDGKLSARELIMRGNAIERGIRQTVLDPMAFEGNRVAPVNEDTCRRILATIMQEAALLYLNTVLSGNNPGVPEIQSSVNHILNLLRHLPLGKLDLGLVLPLAFAGFMADAPAARDVIHKRLQHIASVYGSANVRQIEGVLLQVWARRDAGQREVQWREVMQERGLTLLMI
ncbi:fungal-specific transcription factor domain-containing protein [Lactarius hatsudake]|nr:fungal-specific transcription factor domain-containing protein [Lactarius hatsudake]